MNKKQRLDDGHKFADDELKALEVKITKEYKKALKDLKEEANAYFLRFSALDALMLEKVRKKLITKKEYIDWRNREMIFNRRYNEMIGVLSRQLTLVTQRAKGLIAKYVPPIYIENFNFGGYEVAKSLGIDISFSLVDQSTVDKLLRESGRLLPTPKIDIPKELQWNQAHIRSALTQGIMQGDSIPHIADRLQSVTNMDRAAAIRNARTMTTYAENAGRIDSYRKMEEMGIEVKKQWMATLDEVTRESHRKLDGEIRGVDERFSNGLMQPGDPSGPGEEVYNCRCTLVSVTQYTNSDLSDLSQRYNKLNGKTYAEWKNGK